MRALVLAAIGLALACASSKKEQVAAERGLAALIGQTDIKGQVLALDHDGPTLVTVFASWCEPCRHELATIDELRAEHPSLRVIGVNAYEDFDNLSNQARLEKFLAKSAPWLTVVRDPEKSLITSFGGVPKIPTSFVFDKDRRVVAEFRRDQRDIPSKVELADAIRKAEK